MSTKAPGFGADRRRTRAPSAICRRPREGRSRKPRSGARSRNRRLPRELNGRGGLDPVRYGDWEVKGLASDF